MEPVQQEKVQRSTLTLLKYLLPLVGIAGIAIPIMLHHYDLAVLATYLAIPLILTPLVFHFLTNNPETPHQDPRFLTNLPVFTIALSVFVLLWMTSALILYIFEIRPWQFYGIISILAGIVVGEIFYCSNAENRVPIILTQNIVILLTLIWGVNLKYYQYIGRTDPLAHVYYVQNVLATGHVTDILGVYQPFPLWHILSGITTILTGYVLSVPQVMFLVCGILYAVLIVLIYILLNKLQQDVRISLIGSLFTVFNIDILSYGMSSIPRSIITVLMIFLFLILFLERRPARTILFPVVVISLIIYHPASMPFILIILFTLYILSIFFISETDTPFITLRELITIGTLTLLYWISTAGALLQIYTQALFLPLLDYMMTPATFNAPLVELANYLQYTPFLFFILIGVFASLKYRDSQRILVVFCLMSILMVPFAFPGLATLIEQLSSNLHLDRFGEYSVLFFSIAAAIGTVFIFTRTQKVGKILLFFFLFGFFLLSVSNDFVASDNPLVKRPFYTYYLTQNEIDSSTELAQLSEGYVMADFVITRLIGFSDYAPREHIMEMDRTTLTPVKNNKKDILLVRMAEFSKRPLKMYSIENNTFELNPSWSGNLDYYYENETIINHLDTYSKIFDSRSVTGFT